MGIVCEVCGDVGYKKLLRQCSNCKNAARHLYCLDPVIYDASSFEWLCDDCPSKPSSSCDGHYSIQLGSIFNEPNVNRVEVTNEPLSWGCRRPRLHKARMYIAWGHRRRRSQKARRYSSDASNVTGSSCSTLPNMEQDGVLENVEQPHPSEMVNPDGTSHSHVGPALKIEEQGAEDGLCASVEGVEQTHPILTDETRPIWSSEEQVDGSSPASESWEQPVPLNVIILGPWYDVPNSIVRSKPPSNYSQSMQGSDLYVGNMDVLDSSKERLNSRLKLEQQGAEAGLCASVEGVEQTHPILTDETNPIWSSEEQVDGSSPTSESWEQPDPLEVVRPWDDAPNSILRSRPPSMQGSDLDVGNMDDLDPSKEWMDSRLMSKTVGPSSSSNEGGTSVEKDNTEKTECLSGMDTITPGMDKVQGSNPSGEPSSSSNGEGNSAVEKHSAEMTECLLGMGTLTPALHNVQALNPLTPKECLVPNADNSNEANRSDEVPNSRTPRHTKHQKTKFVMKGGNTDPAHMRSCRPSKQIDRTCSSASLDVSPKTKEVNDAEPRCSKSVRNFENVMAKKRKRPNLSHDEDAEAMQMKMRVRRRHVQSSVMKQRRSTSEEGMPQGNLNNQHVNDHMKARKQRRANKDKKAPLGNASVPCTQNDAARLASDQQSFICMRPNDVPFWTGIMKIGLEYISLTAHLSNQACTKVQELSLSLPALMEVTKHSKLKAWPGRWKASEPTAECIGLYFFSDNMRELDQLVHYLTDHSLVLKYVVGFAKLLIFPSVFLPEKCQKVQGKHYLWGVFKRRMGTGKAGAAG